MKKQIEEYNSIRVLATILVVIGHSAYTTMMTNYGGIVVDTGELVGGVQNGILLLVRLIYSFHMPLFFFLAGCLFDLGKSNGKWVGLLSVIKAKSRRLLIPLFLVGLFYNIPLKALSGYYSNSTTPIFDVFYGQFVVFDNDYLWFLASLFWIFLISWIIDFLVNNKSVHILFAVLMTVIGITFFDSNLLGLQKAFINYIWFAFGELAFENRTRIIEICKKRIIIIILLCSTLLFYAVYLKFFKNNQYCYNALAFWGISICYWICIKLGPSFSNSWLYKKINKESFHIYLFSDPLNYLFLASLNSLGFSRLYGNDLWSILFFFARFIGTIVIAILISRAIEEIKVKLVLDKPKEIN